MKDWLLLCVDILSWDSFSLLLYILWSVWKEHNYRVWNVKSVTLNQLYFHTCEQFFLFKSVCKPLRSTAVARLPKPWVPPPAGQLKANLDGAFDSGSRLRGIGIVIRDSTVVVVGDICSELEDVDSPKLVEFLARYVACLLEFQYNLAPLVFESDCLNLVQATTSAEEHTSPFGRMLDDIYLFQSLFGSFFSHVYHESNMTAHEMAKLALVSRFNLSWSGNIPLDIQSFVLSLCIH